MVGLSKTASQLSVASQYIQLWPPNICNSGLPIYTIKLDSFRCITLSMVVGSVIIQSKSVGGESWALAFLSTSPFFCAFKTSVFRIFGEKKGNVPSYQTPHPPKSLISSFGEKFSQIMMFLEGGLLFCLNQISTTNI